MFISLNLILERVSVGFNDSLAVSLGLSSFVFMIATFESSVLRVYLLYMLPIFACYTRMLKNSVVIPNAS